MTLTSNVKKTILLLADWFEPGFKAGGPIRSCVNFAHEMKDGYEVYVITSDRDLNSEQYKNIVIDRWTTFEPGVKILYCSPKRLSWRSLLREIRTLSPSFVYINSMYSKYFTVFPLLMFKMRLIESTIVLAPRGMLKSTALQFKPTKKEGFFYLMKLLGLHKEISFHATDTAERNDIRRVFGPKTSIKIIPNFPTKIPAYPQSLTKYSGKLSLIFIGRIHPIKNLDYLLRLMKDISGDVQLTILGSEESPKYVARCKELVNHLPSGREVRFIQEVPHQRLSAIIRAHHVFVLPTQGENFGHAIFDAMAEAKPVLISDQTPWRHLASVKAGWDVSLQDREGFIKALQMAIDFNQEEYDEWSRGAWEYAKRFSDNARLDESYRQLFN